MSKKTMNAGGKSKAGNTADKKPSDIESRQKSSAHKNKQQKKDIKSEVDSKAQDKKSEPDKLKEELKEWHDKYLRLSAEFDNFRKRTIKEKADLLRLANEGLLIDLLSVVDDFERGIDTIDKSDNLDALKSGIHLIYNKFGDFIKQKGLKEIDALEKPFDIDYHEAVTKITAPEEKLKGKVVDVIEKGYILNDK
ncbi:MAG: nucleotide exchange factor GrpE, partial [Bacteroidales bacterium]